MLDRDLLAPLSCALLALVPQAASVSPASAAPRDRPLAVQDEEAAQEELRKAEQELARGRYAKAKQRLERLARRYDGTAAARDAWERVQPNALLGWSALRVQGPAENRLDVVVMGEGYPLDKQKVFDDVAEDVPAVFDRDEVFGEYEHYLNFVRANVVSAETGYDGYGRQSDTALGARLVPGDPGELLRTDHAAVRRMLAKVEAAEDLAVVLVPEGPPGTAELGLATVTGRDMDRVLHLFGHAFAGLGDESEDGADFVRDAGPVPNLSTTEDPSQVPWAHWIRAEAGNVGVYEGGSGRVRGVWKPRPSGCRMARGDAYCAVCRETILLALYDRVDPLDEARVASAPDARPGEPLTGEDEHVFEVRVLRPATHELDVRWWVLPAGAEPAAVPEAERGAARRSERGPLPAIDASPEEETRGREGLHRFELDPRRLPAGDHVVLCRVSDDTRVRGEREPWVLADPRGLLVSERRWLVRVAE